MKAYQLKVSGKVQGVFFRHTAKQTAEKLGLAGLAKNESNGSVYIEIEGNETALKQFIDWAHIGSPAASVTSVENTEIDPPGRRGFEIV